jgi:ClpP class serine protease
LAAQPNYVFANNNTTRVGSVGTMLSFADMQPMWEAKGVKFHEIYATASLAKNKDFAEARKGNYDAIIKSTLDPLNNEFLGAVKANRGDKLNQDKTLNGQVYLAQEAQSNGLIDAIGSLQDAVNKVYELAEAKNQKPNLTQQNTMKATITLLAAHAALLAICGATIPEGKESVDVELNNDLLEKINSGLLAAGTAEKALADEKTSHASTQKELDELKAKSAGATATQKEGNDQIEGKEKEDFTCDVDLEMREVRKRIYQN